MQRTKLIGIIEKSDLSGERPFGLYLDIKLQNGNGVSWVVAKDLEAIHQFCKDAKVGHINGLIGKPVECVFDGDGGAGCTILECKIAKQLNIEREG